MCIRTVFNVLSATESFVQLYDVDEDGRLDIIITVMPNSEMGRSEVTRQNEKEYCKTYGKLCGLYCEAVLKLNVY